MRRTEEDEPYYCNPTCSECGEKCFGHWVDEGIGPFEFWGYKGVDNQWFFVSDCCDAEIIEGADDKE
jgi:hypothetical protein